MEQSLSDAQRQLSVKMTELQAAHEQIENLEIRIGEDLLRTPPCPPPNRCRRSVGRPVVFSFGAA